MTQNKFIYILDDVLRPTYKPFISRNRYRETTQYMPQKLENEVPFNGDRQQTLVIAGRETPTDGRAYRL